MAITLSHIDYNYLLDQQKEASNSLAKIVLLSDKLEKTNKQLIEAYVKVSELKHKNKQAAIQIAELTEENLEMKERLAEFAHQLGYDQEAFLNDKGSNARMEIVSTPEPVEPEEITLTIKGKTFYDIRSEAEELLNLVNSIIETSEELGISAEKVKRIYGGAK